MKSATSITERPLTEANLVASALKLQDDRRIDLHYAVAKDIGLDLAKK